METRPRRQKRGLRPDRKGRAPPSALSLASISLLPFRSEALFDDGKRAVLTDSGGRVTLQSEGGFDLLAVGRLGLNHEDSALLLARLGFWNRGRINWSINSEDRFRRREFFIR